MVSTIAAYVPTLAFLFLAFKFWCEANKIPEVWDKILKSRRSLQSASFNCVGSLPQTWPKNDIRKYKLGWLLTDIIILIYLLNKD